MDESKVQAVLDLLHKLRRLYNTPYLDTMIEQLTNGNRDVDNLHYGWTHMDHACFLDEEDAKAVDEAFRELLYSKQRDDEIYARYIQGDIA